MAQEVSGLNEDLEVVPLGGGGGGGGAICDHEEGLS